VSRGGTRGRGGVQGRGGTRTRQRQTAEGVAGREELLDGQDEDSSEEEVQGDDARMQALADAAVEDGGLGRGKRRRTATSNPDQTNPDDIVFSDDEADRERVDGVLGESTAAAAAAAAARGASSTGRAGQRAARTRGGGRGRGRAPKRVAVM
jgi:hypothetical protein